MSHKLRAGTPVRDRSAGSRWIDLMSGTAVRRAVLAGGLCLPWALAAEAAEPAGSGNPAKIRRLEIKAAELDESRAIREARAASEVPRLDAGIAGSENFTVLAPVGSHLADRVLEQAEAHRQELALIWLGEELPAGQQFTHIHVRVKPGADSGRVLLCGPERQLPGHHRMWLDTSEQLALTATLKHELAHVMLNARFPGGMPAWVNEGIASMYDDAPPRLRRKQILAEYVARSKFPQIAELLDRRQLPAGDESGYAVAVSLTELLLARGSRETLLQFTGDGMRNGWQAALQKHYAIQNVASLQREWEASLSSRTARQETSTRTR